MSRENVYVPKTIGSRLVIYRGQGHSTSRLRSQPDWLSAAAKKCGEQQQSPVLEKNLRVVLSEYDKLWGVVLNEYDKLWGVVLSEYDKL